MLEDIKLNKRTHIFYKLIAMMLIMTLTMANFILVAKETYAIVVQETLDAQTSVEGITTEIKNEVEKYLEVEEGVLLQVELNINLQKDSEQVITDGTIEIEVPIINNKLPSKIKSINITTGYTSTYSSSGKLTITPDQIEGETRHKIVYLYSADVWEEGATKTINWKTTVKATVDGKEYSTTNAETAEISNVGNVISTELTIPSEIYKGKMYRDGELETEYMENMEIETSYLSNNSSATISISSQNPQIINKDGSSSDAKSYYISSKISKNYLTEIFADENGKFELEIKSTDEDGIENNITIDETTATTPTESTYILVEYPAKTTSIEIISVSNIKTTAYALKIENKKVLVTNKSTDTVQDFAQLEEKVIVNDIEATSIAELKEPTSNATIALKDIETISAINGEQTVGIIITLNTNSEEKDKLFKNPIFKITMPTGVYAKSIDFSSINIAAQNGSFSVNNAGINENGEIYLEISGEQTDYVESDVNTQITLNAVVTVEKLMANKFDTLKMEYTNNDEVKTTESSPISIVASNQKINTNLKIENYAGEGSVLENYSDVSTEAIGELNILNTSEIQAPVKYTIINNYDTEITAKTSIVVTIKNYKGIEEVSMQELEIENKVVPGQMQLIERTLTIPKNLYYNEEIKIAVSTDYIYSGVEYDVQNILKLATEQKDAIGNIEILSSGIMVESLAQLGDGTVLTDEDEVYNEQIVKYTIRMTNLTSETLSNINVTAEQENGNIYDLVEVEVTNSAMPDNSTIEHEYGEIDTNIKTFETLTLEPNVTKELVYRVVVKMPEEGGKTISNITLGEEKIQIASNTIKEAELKIVSKSSYREEVPIYAGSMLPILTTITNLTTNEVENKKVRIHLSDGIIWNEATKLSVYNGYMTTELENVQYYADENYVEFTIEKLEANQEMQVISYLFLEKMPITETSKEISVYLGTDDNKYISNKIEVTVLQTTTQVIVQQSVNIAEGQKVRDEETVIITGEITNTGNLDAEISISDYLHEGLEVQKVTLIKAGESIDVTEYCRYGILDCIVTVNKGETVKIEIEVKVNTAKIITDEITNVIAAEIYSGDTSLSNTITIQIESDIINGNGTEEPEVPDEPEDPETPDEPENPENPETPENPENPEDPDVPVEEEKYSISGTAWIDKDNDGNKDTNEGLSNITVKLIDLNNKNAFVEDSDGNQIEVKTDENGKYEIVNILKGNYNVIFKYDTDTYELEESTEVQDYIITNNGKEEKVAITNNLNLNADMSNIDLKLIERKEFDLKLDKSITKVIVQTSKETRNTTYANKKLVKEEIKSKLLSGSTVLVEYTMKVTNVGELPGYAVEIMDNLPNGMKFSSEMNTQWYTKTDGSLYSNSLANEVINPGESKEITLILVKNMTNNNTGTTTNNAEITKTSNSREYADINLNNNESSAEIIISTATGGVFTYLIVVLNSVIIILAGIYIIKKKVIK